MSKKEKKEKGIKRPRTRGLLPLSPSEAAEVIRSGGALSPSRKPACLLTFDDGFVSNYSVAEDILAEMNIKAVFFVCPGLVDASVEEQPSLVAKHVFQFELSSLSSSVPFQIMNWSQLRKLRDAGHAIGNHGMWHRRLSLLNLTQFKEEIGTGAELLAREIDGETPWYAYAFGDIESINKQAVAKVLRHHEFCRSGIRGGNQTMSRERLLLADQIDLNAPVGYWRFILDGGFDFRYRKARKRYFAMNPDSKL